MKCNLCGAEIKKTDKYCSFCGAKIEMQSDSTVRTPKKTVSVKSVASSAEYQQPENVSETADKTDVNPKKSTQDKEGNKKKKTVKPGRIIFTVFLISTLITAGIYGLLYFVMDELQSDLGGLLADEYSKYYYDYFYDDYEDFYDEYFDDFYDEYYEYYGEDIEKYFRDYYEDYYYGDLEDFGDYFDEEFDEEFDKFFDDDYYDDPYGDYSSEPLPSMNII